MGKVRYERRVSLVRVGKNVKEALKRALNLLSGIESVVSPGDVVLIKPNLCYPVKPESGAVAKPELIAALAELSFEAGASRVIVGEAPIVGVKTQEVFREAGLDKVAREVGFKLVDLNSDKLVEVEVEGLSASPFKIAKTALKADVILNVPVLKTHILTGVTLGLKNMKGVIPESEKKRFHLIGLEQAIAELNLVVQPSLTVVDGVIGQEGFGPIAGTPVKVGVLVVGRNPVAVDSVACRVMGFKPEKIKHIAKAAEIGVGTLETEVVGVPVKEVCRKFKNPEFKFEEFKGVKIHLGSPCSGCLGAVAIGLLRLKREGELEEVVKRLGGLNVYLGPHARPKPQEKHKNLVVGNCLRKHANEGFYVPGCPPIGFAIRDVVRLMLGLKPLVLSERDLVQAQQH